MAERKGKRTVVVLSSSSEEEYDDVDSEEEEDGDDDYDSSDDDNGEDGSDWSDEEEEESDELEEPDNEDPDGDDESRCNRVIRFLRERNDLEALNVRECKAYLRKHGLRITGTKAACIQRIKEHWRIKDGNCEALYPRSSFVINCTGDVCKGDVVLFTQKVYDKFDKVTRSGRLLGKRTIAGRVVKESYGAAKQQHTFTVEILWSKGIKKLPPLSSLLVKGRNLYRLKTFRQCWNNEAERLKVLAEKHKRGAAARLVRAMKKTKKTSSENSNKTKKTSSENGGSMRQKIFHHTGLSRRRQTNEVVRGKHVDGRGNVSSLGHSKSNNRCQKGPPFGKVNLAQITKSRASKSYQRHQKFSHCNNDKVPTVHTYSHPEQSLYQSQMGSHHRNAPFGFSSYEMAQSSTMMRLPSSRSSADFPMRFPPFRSYGDACVTSAPRHQGFNHSNYTYNASSDPSYNFERRVNRFPEVMNNDKSFRPFPSGRRACEQRKNGFGPDLQ